MYNGIGLQTARGSGTNGYIQANKFHVRARSVRTDGAPPDLGGGAGFTRKPDAGLLEHGRKRQLQLKLAVLEEALEEQGYSGPEIGERLAAARARLEAAAAADPDAADEEANLAAEAQTHHVAARKEKKMETMRAALGISEIKEGEAFDRELQEARRQERQEAREAEEKRRRAAQLEAEKEERQREKEAEREEKRKRREEDRERRRKEEEEAARAEEEHRARRREEKERRRREEEEEARREEERRARRRGDKDGRDRPRREDAEEDDGGDRRDRAMRHEDRDGRRRRGDHSDEDERREEERRAKKRSRRD